MGSTSGLWSPLSLYETLTLATPNPFPLPHTPSPPVASFTCKRSSVVRTGGRRLTNILAREEISRCEQLYSFSIANGQTQQMKGTKRIFGVFEAFFDLCNTHAAKMLQTHYLVRFCGVFAATQNFDTKGPAKGAAKGKF